MDSKVNATTCAQAKQIDMVEYLSKLGYSPSKIRNNDYWYLSPLRDEKTPSFKVNKRLNAWYDHGIGKGGNLIDFAILFHDCTVGEFLQKVNGHSSFQKPPVKQSDQVLSGNKVHVIDEFLLTSYSLIHYLKQRKIPADIADKFCKEVRYELNHKVYYGIGFKNDSGGYEIRNAYFKISSSPKDVTTISKGSKEVTVFEGFFDFLSFMAIHQNQSPVSTDYVILNSIAFFGKARPFMEQHEVINLYLDQDSAGQNCTRYAMSLSRQYRDKSSLYQNYKDLNDWMMNIGKGQKNRK